MSVCPNCGEEIVIGGQPPVIEEQRGARVFHEGEEFYVPLEAHDPPRQAVRVQFVFSSWWFPALELVTHITDLSVKPVTAAGSRMWEDIWPGNSSSEYAPVRKAAKVIEELLDKERLDAPLSEACSTGKYLASAHGWAVRLAVGEFDRRSRALRQLADREALNGRLRLEVKSGEETALACR